MKTQLHENDTNFWLQLTPETIAEAATLARLGLNHTARGAEIFVSAHKTGIEGAVVMPKVKNETSYIKAR